MAEKDETADARAAATLLDCAGGAVDSGRENENENEQENENENEAILG